MINPDLRNRTVLVTGANNPIGIGAAIALRFAEQGANLFLHYQRTPASELSLDARYAAQQAKSCDEVVDRLVATGARVAASEFDFSELSAVGRLFDDAEATVGPVDILINNAAAWCADTFVPPQEPGRNPFLHLYTGRVDSLSPRNAAHQFVVNACAPALLMREYARRHVLRKATRGRIVNISTAGSDCFPSEVSYGASKHALESFTRSAAYELGQFGITVNVLALGPVQTGWITPELERAILPTIPIGRIGTPEEVADVVVFFASAQARWITGQRVFVSGGHHI